MADITGSPGGDLPPLRPAGWQLPVSGSQPAPPGRVNRPPPVLAGGVAGEVRNLAQGTIHHNNGSTTVVTFRLEQHNPAAGRTSIVTVRMKGSRAIGFASEGDWVEALGPASQGFINARRAINRTSGAEFQSSSSGKSLRNGCLIAVGIYLALQVISLIIILAVKA